MKPMLVSEFTPEFDRSYQTHLKRLKLAGLRPKTIEAYSQGLRRAATYFACQIDALSEVDGLFRQVIDDPFVEYAQT
jgi:hypothetical protein